ncbi:cardioacceleratory peptide receptor-like isoform X2 [Limulus polyphemus]|uniref:Cardioacceleratory peptide receptor-like isoform X2 n=1 Tax=Limulus polyphemus TaxID=6850 RepID=A0ABM1BB20_LIMPO|nr:cardioacceleratory peptide receptor-like isoform X2 [Limulus polyphemus]
MAMECPTPDCLDGPVFVLTVLTVNTSDNTSSNSSTEEDEIEYYYFYKTEQITFMWVIFTMIVVGNSSVLVTLLMSKNRKSRMNFFIMHLALADLSVGLVQVLADVIWRMTVDFYGGRIVCKLVRYLQVMVTYSSTYMLVALSIDRYNAITHPMKFRGSWKRARILVVSAWGVSTLASIPAIFLNEDLVIKGRVQCWIDLSPWQWKAYLMLVALSLFFFPALIISTCYSVIVYTIWNKSKAMGYPKIQNNSILSKRSTVRQNASIDSDIDSRRASSRGIIPKAKIKSVKMTLVIVFVFILCWSPYFIYDLLQVYGFIPINQTLIAISTFIQALAPLNSAANPIIYCFFSSPPCKNFKKVKKNSTLNVGSRKAEHLLKSDTAHSTRQQLKTHT